MMELGTIGSCGVCGQMESVSPAQDVCSVFKDDSVSTASRRTKCAYRWCSYAVHSRRESWLFCCGHCWCRHIGVRVDAGIHADNCERQWSQDFEATIKRGYIPGEGVFPDSGPVSHCAHATTPAVHSLVDNHVSVVDEAGDRSALDHSAHDSVKQGSILASKAASWLSAQSKTQRWQQRTRVESRAQSAIRGAPGRIDVDEANGQFVQDLSMTRDTKKSTNQPSTSILALDTIPAVAWRAGELQKRGTADLDTQLALELQAVLQSIIDDGTVTKSPRSSRKIASGGTEPGSSLELDVSYDSPRSVAGNLDQAQSEDDSFCHTLLVEQSERRNVAKPAEIASTNLFDESEVQVRYQHCPTLRWLSGLD